MTPEILILGLGNPLMADDGVGAAVVEELRRLGVPDRARVEVAPDILHLPSIWHGEPEVWLVDAVTYRGEAAAVHYLEHSEIVGMDDNHRSAHQLSLPEGLRWLMHCYTELAEVRFRLWGVEPATLAPAPQLSGDVAAAVHDVALAIASEARPGELGRPAVV